MNICREIVANLKAAELWQPQVEHHEVGPVVVETAERLQAVCGFGHVKAGNTQRVSEHGAEIVVILHNENPLRHE